MRIHFASKAHCANVAKSLKRHLSASHPDLKLSDCQNAVGRMMGYRHWHELERHCSAAVDPSPYDDQVDALHRAGRRVQFAATLATVLGLGMETGFDVVDRIAPMASKAPMGPVEQDRGERGTVTFTLFEGDWGAGVAVRLDDGEIDRHTYLVGAFKDGRFGLYEAGHAARDPGSYTDAIGSGTATKSWHMDHVLGLLGYRASEEWTENDEDGKPVNASDSRLAAARAHLEKHLDTEFFIAWARAPGMVMAPVPYDLVREAGPRQERRKAFAREYGGYLNYLMAHWYSRQADIDDAPTPAEAVAAHLVRTTELGREEALAILRRTGRLRFVRMSGHDMELGYVILSGMDDRDLPVTQAEMEAFSECLGVLDNAIKAQALGMAGHLRRVLVTAKGSGTWASCLSRIDNTAAIGAARLRGMGIELDDEDAHPKDHVYGFFGNVDDCMSEFAWKVVEPAVGLTDPRVAAVHLGKASNQGKKGALIPPTAFENACGKLFLEGLRFEDLAELCLSWHVQRHEEGWMKGAVSPLTRAAVEARLDQWRRFLRPAYRDIDLQGVLDAWKEGMAAKGATIGRKGRPDRAAKPDVEDVDLEAALQGPGFR